MRRSPKYRSFRVRVYEIVVILSVVGGGFLCWQGYAAEPAPVVKNIPNTIYATPASYRRHRRYRYGFGGK
ncbi:MAG: hypothetical protein VX223_14705 [Myxococcota bacterium]|nr:hypothetical protein [Myxococcota bacterium]